METYTAPVTSHPYMTDSGRLAFALAIVLGLVLVVLGIGAYVASDFASVTALIPTVFGVLIALLALVGYRTDRRRSAAYGIGLLALLGILGSARGIPDIVALLTGGPVESTVAAVSQGLMIAISLVLLAAVAWYVLAAR